MDPREQSFEFERSNESLIQFLGIEDFTIDEPIVNLKYSKNKRYAVVIFQKDDKYHLRIYKYQNLQNTWRIKNIFKEQLPHWHLDGYADKVCDKCRYTFFHFDEN